MKTAVLLSGGVDSSVALRLLKDQGHDLTAFYLKIWLQDEFSFLGDCPWEEDLKFVKAVCKQNNIPLEILSLQNEYWDSVVTYTIAEIKEQTYFLAYLTQHQLARAFFPIGEYDKKQIRKMAERFNLPNKNRKDSQGICFLGQVKFNEFVKHHLGELVGDIIEADRNKKLGQHNGYYFYTIGQRSGLKLSGGPWFVVGKDVKQNIIYVSRENKLLREKNEFSVGKFNWISGSAPTKKNLKVKIRHGAKNFKCNVNFSDHGMAVVKLEEADSGIAPGQFAVFYYDDLCFGGGGIL